MKKILAVLLPMICVVMLSVPAAVADTLTLVSTSGGNSGGEDIYPYNFSVNGSPDLTDLMCLNLDRLISFGETWQVAPTDIPLDNSQTSINYRADALLFYQTEAPGNTYSLSDIQWAAWSIFDPAGVAGNSAFTPTAQSLAQGDLIMAQVAGLTNSGFYNKFTLYLPTSDQTGWTYGIPQSFIGNSPVPEPSSLLMLGSGLMGFAGMARRKLRAK